MCVPATCHGETVGFCPGASHEPWVINDREDLAALRDELNETIAKLNALEQTLPSGVRSIEEAQAVQHGLETVIERVQNIANELGGARAAE